MSTEDNEKEIYDMGGFSAENGGMPDSMMEKIDNLYLELRELLVEKTKNMTREEVANGGIHVGTSTIGSLVSHVLDYAESIGDLPTSDHAVYALQSALKMASILINNRYAKGESTSNRGVPN